MSITKVHPALPKSLLQELKGDTRILLQFSLIYSDSGFQKFRLMALNRGEDGTEREVILHSDIPRSQGSPPTLPYLNFTAGQKKTFLHYAASWSDIPLLLECVRLGVVIDYKDKDGATALLSACQALLSATLRQENPFVLSSLTTDHLWRCTKVATILIEQHADVNVCQKKSTPLHLACKAKNWPLIEILLQHGANPNVPGLKKCASLFQSASEKNQFGSLVLMHARVRDSSQSRPPRPCPCWSGKMLSDCHDAQAHPYPRNFLCQCSSARTYGNCCGRRGIDMTEYWHRPGQYICSTRSIISNFYKGDNESVVNVVEQLRKQFPDMSIYNPIGFAYHKQIMDELLLKTKRADIAFIYAAKMLPFLALPFERHISSVEGSRREMQWNDAIDQYITSGVDERPVYEIEKESKVDRNGEPFYKRCSAPGCTVTETMGVDSEKMKRCGRCKSIYYCSGVCGTADWVRHKELCRKTDAKDMPVADPRAMQILPSQREYDVEINKLQLDGARRIIAMSDRKEAFTNGGLPIVAVFFRMACSKMWMTQG